MRNVVADLVHNAQFHGADHAADGAVHLLRIVGQAGVGVKPGLQHAVELDQVAVHPPLEITDGLDRGGSAAGDDDAQRSGVEPVQLGVIQDRDDRGGRGGDIGDALLLDQFEGAARSEPLEQHGTGARHDRLQQAQVAPVQAHRQIDQHHVALGDLHILVEDVACVERAVEGMQDAFRVAGRARGERHAENLVRVHMDAVLVRNRRTFAQSPIEIVRAFGRAAGDDNVGEGGNRLLQRLRHGHIIEALELARTDEGAAVGKPQDVFQLARPEVGIDLVGDGADQLQREEDDREVDPIGQLDGDHVAALDPDAAQEFGAALDFVLQLAIGDAALRVGEHLAVRMCGRTPRQHLEERFSRPQAARLVALGEFRFEHDLKRHGRPP